MRHKNSIISGCGLGVSGGVALMACLIGGCHDAGRIDDPSARVLGVSLEEWSKDGVRLELMVEMENPNGVPLPLADSEYTITLERSGEYEFEERVYLTLPGSYTHEGDVKEAGRQVLRLPVSYPTPAVDPVGLGYRVEGTVTYNPPGEIRRLLTEANFPLPTSEFKGSGKVR